MEFLHITYGDMDLPLTALLPHGKCFAGLKVHHLLPACAPYCLPAVMHADVPIAFCHRITNIGLQHYVDDSGFCSLQVTGDPNVPAGKISFCASADNVKLGRYDGFEREEVAPGEYERIYRDIGQ